MVTAVCLLRKPHKRRTQINLTIAPDVLSKIRELMAEVGETSLSAFTESLYECVLRDSCEGCPAYENLPEDEKVKITGKVGVGKWITNEEESQANKVPRMLHGAGWGEPSSTQEVSMATKTKNKTDVLKMHNI